MERGERPNVRVGLWARDHPLRAQQPTDCLVQEVLCRRSQTASEPPTQNGWLATSRGWRATHSHARAAMVSCIAARVRLPPRSWATRETESTEPVAAVPVARAPHLQRARLSEDKLDGARVLCREVEMPEKRSNRPIVKSCQGPDPKAMHGDIRPKFRNLCCPHRHLCFQHR